MRLKSLFRNQSLFCLHGIAYDVKNPRMVPMRKCAPGRNASAGIPATVMFSPANPGLMGWPSARSVSIASVDQMHSACHGRPWWARFDCTSPSTPFHPITAESNGFFGNPFDACKCATEPTWSIASDRMVGKKRHIAASSDSTCDGVSSSYFSSIAAVVNANALSTLSSDGSEMPAREANSARKPRAPASHPSGMVETCVW